MEDSHIKLAIIDEKIKHLTDKHEDLYKKLDKKTEELEEIRLWRSNLQGRLIVVFVVGGAIWSIFLGLFFYLINKN